MTEDQIPIILSPDDPTPDNPDHYHYKWINYCLYCHTEDYDPAANHGLRLQHYCVNCVMVCRECQEPKPLFAFAFNYESLAYKSWRDAIKIGGKTFKEWMRFTGKNAIMGHAPKEAHTDHCCHCDGRQRQALEDIQRAEATKRKLATIAKQNAMLADASAQSALSAILENVTPS